VTERQLLALADEKTCTAGKPYYADDDISSGYILLCILFNQISIGTLLQPFVSEVELPMPAIVGISAQNTSWQTIIG
jgi:hypothetical protein